MTNKEKLFGRQDLLLLLKHSTKLVLKKYLISRLKPPNIKQTDTRTDRHSDLMNIQINTFYGEIFI